jgi:hypothetical protein
MILHFDNWYHTLLKKTNDIVLVPSLLYTADVTVTAIICWFKHNVPMSYSHGIAGW